jgi:isocitrate dehydrogenase
MDLVLSKWIYPYVDTTEWQYYDLSCISRDKTDDQALRDAVAAGKNVGAIFKEPTVTPTAVQKEKLGLSKTFGSPNGAMRKGWNGITISRDTIHIKGMRLGFKNPVLFERHAVGGEYSAGYGNVGKGSVTTVYTPDDLGPAQIIDHRRLADEDNAIVTYSNPLDNVEDLAHHFFTRCLEQKVVPYVVTKKTVFKWQEGFWEKMKTVFDANYKEQYLAAGLLNGVGGELPHLISDAATMKIVNWRDGGFGMAAHNYDGDMLTDEIAQIHRSPGFLTSNLIGKREDGVMIKEYEASHGTVADMWDAHNRGEETSLNPLGMVEALIGAIQHACAISGGNYSEVVDHTNKIRDLIHGAFLAGKGTRDLSGPSGLTTEQFVDHIAAHLSDPSLPADTPLIQEDDEVDMDKVDLKEIFAFLDKDGNNSISYDEFVSGLKDLKIARQTAIGYYNTTKRKIREENPRKKDEMPW